MLFLKSIHDLIVNNFINSKKKSSQPKIVSNFSPLKYVNSKYQFMVRSR